MRWWHNNSVIKPVKALKQLRRNLPIRYKRGTFRIGRVIQRGLQ